MVVSSGHPPDLAELRPTERTGEREVLFLRKDRYRYMNKSFRFEREYYPFWAHRAKKGSNFYDTYYYSIDTYISVRTVSTYMALVPTFFELKGTVPMRLRMAKSYVAG
jgi:hypothetical protein